MISVWSPTSVPGNYEPGIRILRSAQFLRSVAVKRSRKGFALYQSAECLTLQGFPNHSQNDSTWQTEGFAMGQAIVVRTDYTSDEVRQLAKRAKDASQARRLLAIAVVLDGA